MSVVRRVLAVMLLLALPCLIACSAPTGAASDRDTPPPRHISVRIYHTDSTTPNVLVNVPLRVVTIALRVASVARAFGASIEISGIEIGGKRTVHLDDVDLEAVREAILAMEPGPVIQIEEGGERVEIWIN